MTPETVKKLFRLAITSVFPNAIFDDDDELNDDYDETGRPRYILCDEIWDILAEAGHGAEVIIHSEKPETLYLFNPLHGLDAEATERLFNRLKALAETGTKVIIGTAI